jgi:hypothetical protein
MTIGQDPADACVIIAVTASGVFLSWCLFGAKAATTLMGITAAGIVLRHMSSRKPNTRSRKKSRPLHSSRTRYRSEGNIADSNKENYTLPPVHVTPDLTVSYRPKTRRRLRPLEDISQSLNFDGNLSL